MSRFLAGGASSSNGEKYEVAKGSRKDVDYGSIANLINNEVSWLYKQLHKHSSQISGCMLNEKKFP